MDVQGDKLVSLLIPSSVLQTTNRRPSRYLARVVQVFPPRPPPPPPIARPQANGFASSSSSSPLSDEGPHFYTQDCGGPESNPARVHCTRRPYKIYLQGTNPGRREGARDWQGRRACQREGSEQVKVYWQLDGRKVYGNEVRS